MSASIEEKIRELMTQSVDVDISKLTSKDPLIDYLDSLSVVELVMAVEEEFDITISDDEAEKMKNIDDIIHHIEKANKSP